MSGGCSVFHTGILACAETIDYIRLECHTQTPVWEEMTLAGFLT